MNAPLAVAAATAAAADGCDQYLTFFLGEELFAVNIRPIREISEYGRVTPVPMAPPEVRGVINLRGCAVPVIDLAQRFGGSPLTVGKRSCIVMVEVERTGTAQTLGLLIDRVSEVLEIADRAIGAAPRFGNAVHSDFIQGMAQIGDRFSVVLDLQRLLADDELEALAQVAAAV